MTDEELEEAIAKRRRGRLSDRIIIWLLRVLLSILVGAIIFLWKVPLRKFIEHNFAGA
jgi:hypothetical protein